MIKQTWQHQAFLSVLMSLLVCGNSYAVKVEDHEIKPNTTVNKAQTTTAKTNRADIRQVATGGDNGVGEISTGGDNGVGELSSGGDNGVGELSTGGDNGVGEMSTNARKAPEKISNPK
jgi:hypothetical protein